MGSVGNYNPSTRGGGMNQINKSGSMPNLGNNMQSSLPPI
jgi:hypothetical protein